VNGRDDDHDGLGDSVDPDCSTGSRIGGPGGPTLPCSSLGSSLGSDKRVKECGGPGGPVAASFPGGLGSTSRDAGVDTGNQIGDPSNEGLEFPLAGALVKTEVGYCADGIDNDDDNKFDNDDSDCSRQIGTLLNTSTNQLVQRTYASADRMLNLQANNEYLSVSNSPDPIIRITSTPYESSRSNDSAEITRYAQGIEVLNGSTVTWVNKNSNNQSSFMIKDKASDQIVYSSNGPSGPFTTYKFSIPGEYVFYDTFNPNLTINIKVAAPSASGTTGSENIQKSDFQIDMIV